MYLKTPVACHLQVCYAAHTNFLDTLKMSESGDLLKTVGAIKMYLIVNDKNGTFTYNPDALKGAKVVLTTDDVKDAGILCKVVNDGKKGPTHIIEGYFVPERKL